MNKRLLCALMISSLTACGGSGSGSSNTNNSTDTPTETPTSASGVATQGMITGFGSVIVNGIHYDVDDANIEMDGESVVESDLEVGQMVRITGTLSKDGVNGVATKVEGESQLRGPIESIDLEAGTLVAMGQTIVINADTFYQHDLSAEQLQVGDIIKVSGYTDADGAMVATFIARKNETTGKSMGFTGTLSDLDTTAQTFMVNGQLVDYSQATLSSLPDSTLENGMSVRIHGSLVEGVFVAVGNIHLSSLDFKHHEPDTDVDVEISGVITNMESADSFYVGENHVLVTTDTEIKNGDLIQLANGVSVKVEGELDAEGNLLADEIKLGLAPHINSKGLIEAIDLEGSTITVNGEVYEITPETSFTDRSHFKVRFFDLQDLTLGDAIQVRGYRIAATETTAERLVATRIERRNQRTDEQHQPNDPGFEPALEIEGVVEAVNESVITIAGHDITLTEQTKVKGFADLASFLAAAVGAEIEVKARLEDDVLYALVIEQDDEDDDVTHHHRR